MWPVQYSRDSPQDDLRWPRWGTILAVIKLLGGSASPCSGWNGVLLPSGRGWVWPSEMLGPFRPAPSREVQKALSEGRSSLPSLSAQPDVRWLCGSANTHPFEASQSGLERQPDCLHERMPSVSVDLHAGCRSNPHTGAIGACGTKGYRCRCPGSHLGRQAQSSRRTPLGYTCRKICRFCTEHNRLARVLHSGPLS